MKYYIATIDGRRKLFPWEKDIPKGVKADEIDIPTSKEGLQAAIQELLAEADEAKLLKADDLSQIEEMSPAIAQAIREERSVESKRTDYTEWSVRVDDNWDKLPLARKLHFAALAMEEARSKL